MEKIFLKVISGSLFGLGLLSTIVGCSYLFEKYIIGLEENTYVAFNDNAGLVVVNQHDRKTDNGVVVLGTIVNNGENAWRYIELEAEVFDVNRVFIEECNARLQGTVKPGEKENFKIVCGGKSCGKAKLPEYKSISVSIKGAAYSSGDDNGVITFVR